MGYALGLPVLLALAQVIARYAANCPGLGGMI
jgi:hypothetical protein